MTTFRLLCQVSAETQAVYPDIPADIFLRGLVSLCKEDLGSLFASVSFQELLAPDNVFSFILIGETAPPYAA